MALKSPHLLLAGANCRRLRENIAHLLDPAAVARIDAEIDRNVAALFRLARQHFGFARGLEPRQWRQKVSRLYFAGHNANRSIRLCVKGEYSTESSDHQKISQFPDDFPRRAEYGTRLVTLRSDRNLCDYDHAARRRDLIISPNEALELIRDLLADTRGFLKARGISV